MIKTDQEGAVTYYWTRKNSTKPLKKIAYVKLFPPYEWVVGAGSFMEDKIEEI